MSILFDTLPENNQISTPCIIVPELTLIYAPANLFNYIPVWCATQLSEKSKLLERKFTQKLLTCTMTSLNNIGNCKDKSPYSGLSQLSILNFLIRSCK